MVAVERPVPLAVTARARKSVRTILLLRSPRQTRVAHRGGRPVRRKRRPTAAVDNPALCHADVFEYRKGSPVSAMLAAVVLIWVHFSAQILLVGAEFTCVYARIFGPRTPTSSAQPNDLP